MMKWPMKRWLQSKVTRPWPNEDWPPEASH